VKIGFTPQQFCIHSRGYLEACRQVIPLFEKAAARAKEQGDHISLAILNENLNEEYGMQPSGEQDEAKVHTNLARQSHHLHAQLVFEMAIKMTCMRLWMPYGFVAPGSWVLFSG